MQTKRSTRCGRGVLDKGRQVLRALQVEPAPDRDEEPIRMGMVEASVLVGPDNAAVTALADAAE